jgi:hypothetical protein
MFETRSGTRKYFCFQPTSGHIKEDPNRPIIDRCERGFPNAVYSNLSLAALVVRCGSHPRRFYVASRHCLNGLVSIRFRTPFLAIRQKLPTNCSSFLHCWATSNRVVFGKVAVDILTRSTSMAGARRAHNKTRLGCGGCKKRRVKVSKLCHLFRRRSLIYVGGGRYLYSVEAKRDALVTQCPALWYPASSLVATQLSRVHPNRRGHRLWQPPRGKLGLYLSACYVVPGTVLEIFEPGPFQ